MPSVKKSDAMNDRMNIPIPTTLKRRIIRLAQKCPTRPKHTHYARLLLEKAVDEAERPDSPFPLARA